MLDYHHFTLAAFAQHLLKNNKKFFLNIKMHTYEKYFKMFTNVYHNYTVGRKKPSPYMSANYVLQE